MESCQEEDDTEVTLKRNPRVAKCLLLTRVPASSSLMLTILSTCPSQFVSVMFPCDLSHALYVQRHCWTMALHAVWCNHSHTNYRFGCTHGASDAALLPCCRQWLLDLALQAKLRTHVSRFEEGSSMSAMSDM